MTPAARVQAAIELLDEVIDAARREGAPADRLIANYFKQRRYAGSKDRRAVRELVYAAIRHCGEVPVSGRAALLALAQAQAGLLEFFDGSNHGPAPVEAGEAIAEPGVAPDWLSSRFAESGLSQEEIRALMGRAPLDLRVNTLKAERGSLDLAESGLDLALSNSLRFPAGTPVEQWPQYRQGLVEVQDFGSQLVCEAAAAKPGEAVIDLCAGAGGKTLAMAASMQNEGVLIASDTDRARLSRLAPRAERAGASMIEPRLLNPGQELERLSDFEGQADLVLIDAPCSGTGTWRRKPEAKWRLTPARLERYAKAQDYLLDIGVKLLGPGGRICFVTCSLLDAEGADRIEAFLERNQQFNVREIDLPLGVNHRNGTRLSPFHDDTDGFFVALLGLPC